MSNLSIGNIWSEAWAAFKRNWLTGVLLLILLVVIDFIPIIGPLIGLFLLVTPVQWGLQATRRETPISFGDAFPSSFMTYLKVLVGNFILGLIIILAFLILLAIMGGISNLSDANVNDLTSLFAVASGVILVTVVFAFFVQVLFWIFPYWIVDKGEGIFSSMQKSVAVSTRNLGTFIGFFLSVIGINLLGLLICGVGLFITGPLSWAALAVLYQRVADQLEGESPSATS